jgi:hypothetical protein
MTWGKEAAAGLSADDHGGATADNLAAMGGGVKNTGGWLITNLDTR